MKLSKRLNELINSGITLSASEVKEVEEFIHKKSKKVKPQHLDEWKCVVATRGRGSDKQ